MQSWISAFRYYVTDLEGKTCCNFSKINRLPSDEKTLFNRIFLGDNQQGLCCTHVVESPYVVSNDLLELVHSFCFHLCNNIIDSIHHFGFFHPLNCSNFLQHLWHRGRFSGYENKGCWQSNLTKRTTMSLLVFFYVAC